MTFAFSPSEIRMPAKRHWRKRKLAAAALLAGSALGLAPGVQAAGISADPGDYTALPPGTNLGLLYVQRFKANDVYADGNKVVSNLGLTLDVVLARYVHYFSLGGMTAEWQVIAPFGRQKIDLASQKLSGAGNLILGAGIYPIADLKANHHLGFTAFITPPSGSHRNDGFALSPNRYSYNLQTGYIQGLTKELVLDANAQVEFYGNDRTTSSKKSAYVQIDSTLRYYVAPTTFLAGTVRLGFNGEEKLNGQKLGSEKRGSALLGVGSFLTPQWQVLVQYRQDFSVEDGPKLKGLQARMLYLF
jgi:hypothetical protein